MPKLPEAVASVARCPPIPLAALLFAYLVVGLQQQAGVAAAACAFVLASSWPLIAVAGDERDLRDYPVAVMAAAIGVSLAGLVALAGAALGVHPLGAALGYGAALWTAALVRLIRLRRARHKDRGTPIDVAPPSTRNAVAAAALSVIGAAPILVYAVLMGRGEYPAVFFNDDNPYHLSHVWSMLRDHTYPVMSLGVFGERRVYQYGGQATAAMLSAVSGIAPHSAYFGLVFPVYKLAAIAAAWRLAKALHPGLPVWVTVGTLALVSRFPIDPAEVSSAWSLLAGGSSGMAGARNLFDIDHVLTHFGYVSALVVAAWAAGDRSPAVRFAMLVSLALLPVFKMSFFLGLGAGFGACSLVRALRGRSIAPLVPGLAVLASALAIVRILGMGSGDTSGNLVLSPLSHLQDFLAPIAHKIRGALGEPSLPLVMRGLRITALEYAANLHWLVFAAMTLLVAGRERVPRHWPEWLALVTAPLVLINIVKYTRGGLDDESIRSSIDTTFTLVPYLVLSGALAVAAAAARVDGRRRGALVALFTAYMGYFAVTDASAVLALTRAPQVGYEYASNAAIAEALSHVPAGRAVIATNDTRYRPSSPVDRQLQIPSIFGHRAYFVDGVNDRFDVTGA
ncbi:MAG: hypothetical protein ACRD26_07295, partial [Vicinamibacterales bacterium]